MTVLLYRYGRIEAMTFNRSIELYKILNSSESERHKAIALFDLFAVGVGQQKGHRRKA